MCSEHPATAAIALAATLGLGLVVVSCNKSPTQPSNAPGGPQGGAVAVARIEISGPTSLEPGGSAQFTANAEMSDGSVRNVTAEAEWTSSHGGVLQVSSPGIVSAVAAGEAVINARYQSRSASAPVMVLPAGTFRLNGRITDVGRPVGGVTVEVIEGTGQGLRAVTRGDGSYAIYGVAGLVKLHAKKEGFANNIEQVEVNESRAFDFELRFDGERGELSGTYTLGLDLTRCRPQLPEATRSRSYAATLEQQGSNLEVHLSGADFIQYDGRGDHFAGVVDKEGRITFDLGSGYYYYYQFLLPTFDIVERLDATSALAVAGTVEATTTASGISGTLVGSAAVTRGTSGPFTNFSTTCYADGLPFEMRRQ